MIEELEYVRQSLTSPYNERIKSLILAARDKDSAELASVYCTVKGWEVAISATTTNEVSKISWDTFLELVHQFSIFVSQENAALLRECQDEVGDKGEK